MTDIIVVNIYHLNNFLDPCKESIYPPGYIPGCMVVQKQWTYNRTTGQCVEFSYHPCGQDREGYDVFKTELECTQTCVQQGISANTVLLVAATVPLSIGLTLWCFC